MSATAPTFQPPGPCACAHPQCAVIGTKLVQPLEFGAAQHLRGCNCPPHRGKRNVKKGKRGEARSHRELGGLGPTIRDDLHHSYSINVTVERKTGDQVPAKLVEFFGSTWYDDAIGQAIKKLPVGADAHPALHVFPTGGGSYLLVHIGTKELR